MNLPPTNYTPYSILFCKINVCLCFLQACMDPDQPSSQGQGAVQLQWCGNEEKLPELFSAIIKKDAGEVQRLIDKGENSNQPGTLMLKHFGSIRLDPLSLAVELSYTEIVKILIKQTDLKGEIVLEKNIGLASMCLRNRLCHAIQVMRFSSIADNLFDEKVEHQEARWLIFKILVAELKARGQLDKAIDQALHYAVLCRPQEAMRDVIEELLKQGAHPPKEVPYFIEPRQWFCRNTIIDRHSEDKNTVFHISVLEGDSEIVAKLLHAVADKTLLNAKNAKNKTPLQLAMYYGHFKLAWWLVEKGAKIDVLPSIFQKTADFWITEIQDLVKVCKNLVEKDNFSVLEEPVNNMQAFLSRYRKAAYSCYKKTVCREDDATTAINFNDLVDYGLYIRYRLAYFQAFFTVDSPITMLEDLGKALRSIPNRKAALAGCKNNVNGWESILYVKKKGEVDYLNKIIDRILHKETTAKPCEELCQEERYAKRARSACYSPAMRIV